MAIEKPKFAVLVKSGDFELRDYAPYIVAETVVETTDFGEAGNEGFRRLGGYIFGENLKDQKVSMTAPVIQQTAPAPGRDGEKISMTAPVSTEATAKGYRVAFMMPSEFTLDKLPRPKDPRITFRTIGSRRVAAIRFSGGWDTKKFKDREESLLRWVQEKGWTRKGDPIVARYNPPFMPSFLRRNEILIEVNAPDFPAVAAEARTED
jgi:hypothetical protein